MQICAENDLGEVVYAQSAHKQQDYFCLECRGTVRLRSGLHRQSHFYHLNLSPECRQSKKSLEHLQVQQRLLALLPKSCLEKRFNQIKRIADVVWEPEKLVFEVQYSPITALEVMQRNQDYLSIGYDVVWILHEVRYGQWKMTAAEAFLRQHTHYFTDIDEAGEGIIYDFFAVERRGRRIQKGWRNEVDLSHPSRRIYFYPKSLAFRALTWKVSFAGDLLQQSDIPPIVVEVEPKLEWMEFLQNWVKRLYFAFFHLFLERSCK